MSTTVICRLYALKLKHQKELIDERILWTGGLYVTLRVGAQRVSPNVLCSWRDFWIFTRSNHPLLSVFLVDSLHPFSKTERFFHGIVTVLYRQHAPPSLPHYHRTRYCP
jgi:hypothetical protein